jgi:outer membrane protein insertion porin family
LALLLGAGFPVEQIGARAQPADEPSARAREAAPATKDASGFEMVPGPAPAGLLPQKTPETPGAGGFELLPPAAAASSSQASAAGQAPRNVALSAADPVALAPTERLVQDSSGFQMVAANAAPAAEVQPDPGASGFELTPANPLRLAPAAPAPSLQQAAGLTQVAARAPEARIAEPLAPFIQAAIDATAARAPEAEAPRTVALRFEPDAAFAAAPPAPVLERGPDLLAAGSRAPSVVIEPQRELELEAAAPMALAAARPTELAAPIGLVATSGAGAPAAAMLPAEAGEPLRELLLADATQMALTAEQPAELSGPTSFAPTLRSAPGAVVVAAEPQREVALAGVAPVAATQTGPIDLAAPAGLPSASSSAPAAFLLAAEDAPGPKVEMAPLSPLLLEQAAPAQLVRASLAPAKLARSSRAAMLPHEPASARVKMARVPPLFLANPEDYRLAAPARLELVAFTSAPEAAIERAGQEPEPPAAGKLRKSRLKVRRASAPAAPSLRPALVLASVARATPEAYAGPAPGLAASEPGPMIAVAMDQHAQAAPLQAAAMPAAASAEPVSAVADAAPTHRLAVQPVAFERTPARAEPAILRLAQADAAPPPPAPAPSAAPPAEAQTAPAPAAPPAAPETAPAAPPAAAGAAPAPSANAPTSTAPAAERTLGVVGRIQIQGNERIEPTTITSYLPIQVGDTVDNAKIDLAVKTLFRTDLFADVTIELQGSDLVVRVAENPIINQVVFEGNHALKEDKLRDEVTVRPRGIFTRSKVEQDVQKIIELYRRSGRISVTVTPKIIQLPQKRIDLIFEIDEGPKSGILHINFIGNKQFSDTALRDVIVTRESHWYKFFQSNDNYDPDRIEYDREQIRKFYRNHGFYDFKIISAVAELAPDKNGFVVTFTIDEGPKYHFGKLTVNTELKRLNGELLQALLPIRTGQLYEDERIEKATDALTYAAGANGFAFVDVRPRYVAHAETKTVDVSFDIKEGPRVYIERIDVVGNTRTLDYVIRREMRVGEGDAYNRVLVDRSKNQIKALGFFKDVDIEQLPGTSPDKTILRVKVTEQPTGQLTFSLGYSSIEKLVGDVGISESNFRGRGQKVDFEVSLGYLRKQITLSFTEPRFRGSNMSAGFDIYTYRYNYSTTASFTTSSTGLNLRTGFPINQYAALQLRYSIHADQVSLPSYVYDPATKTCASGYSTSLCDEVGTTFTSSVGYTVRWDRRNDPITATRGFYMDLSQDFAGIGGIRYIRSQTDGAWYYGFTPKWIFSVQGRAGYITGWGGNVVRINDRFFEGGDSFRGFQIAGLGPRDTNPAIVSNNGQVQGDALGGKAFAIGTVELTVPTPIPAQYGIKTALFSDFGTVGLLDPSVKRKPDGTIDPNIKDDLAFRASAGISVFWKSPMGPLRFDFSKVFAKAPYDVKETFRFSTATQFY